MVVPLSLHRLCIHELRLFEIDLDCETFFGWILVEHTTGDVHSRGAFVERKGVEVQLHPPNVSDVDRMQFLDVRFCLSDTPQQLHCKVDLVCVATDNDVVVESEDNLFFNV